MHRITTMFSMGAVLAASSVAQAQLYVLRDLGGLGGTNSNAEGISRSGSFVVGGAENAAGQTRPFVWNGTIQPLPLIAGYSCGSARDVNDSGLVVGTAFCPAGGPAGMALKWQDGVVSNIDPLNDNYASGRGVNNAGRFTLSTSRPGNYRAAIWEGGVLNIFPMPQAFQHCSAPTAVNDQGVVCGDMWDGSGCNAGTSRGFIYDGSWLLLNGLGGVATIAGDINTSRTAAGMSQIPGGGERAVLWANTPAPVQLGSLGGVGNSAYSINDAGTIVGRAQRTDGVWVGFVWNAGTMVDLNTLVPERFGLTIVLGSAISEGGAIAGKATDAQGAAHAILLTPCEPASIGAQSMAQSACVSGSVGFSLTAGGTGPFTYHWRKNTAPIDTVAVPSAATATLTLASVGPADIASYDCIVTNACGSVTSNPAQLFVDPTDVGRQGGLPGRDGLHDNNDFVVFIDLFFNQQPGADLGKQGGLLGSDGLFDNNDFVVFIDQFFAAC